MQLYIIYKRKRKGGKKNEPHFFGFETLSLIIFFPQ